LQTSRAGNTDTIISSEIAETVFPAVPESVSAARRFTRAALARHGITDGTIDIAMLLVSELATNSLVHAKSDIRLRVRVGDEVRIEVCDASPHGPVTHDDGLERESGRGLELVSSLADEWDWDRRANGKVVWFTLAHARQASGAGRR
jgi:anti-sigma regulatory factor (Ser/Thr protein kinase)